MRLSFVIKGLFLTHTLLFYTEIQAATVVGIELMGTPESLEIATAADDDSNAITVFTQSSQIGSRYSLGNLLWEPNVIISNGLSTKSAPDIAMDATSTALAVWQGLDSGTSDTTIEANHFSGGAWDSSVILEGPIPEILVGPTVAMNGSGGGVAAWARQSLLFPITPNEIHASFYNAGAWQPFEVIGTQGFSPVQAAYSANGNAGVIWTYLNDIYVATSNGLTWLPETLLDSSGSSSPDIGMDANGNAIAIWIDTSDNIIWSRFDGATWSTGQVLSLASGIYPAKIAVAPAGEAVVVWIDSDQMIQMSQFNGSTWSAPTPIASGILQDITMDSNGNTLIGWKTLTNELYTVYLPLGGSLENPLYITTGADSIGSIDFALSSSATVGVSAWRELRPGEGQADSFATFLLFDDPAPTPPTGITGRVCKNNFAMQSDRVHIISWDASTDPTVVSYYVYRNGVLIGIVPSTGPLTFYDHNRRKGSPDTYSVYAVNSEGTLSSPVSITLD